MGTAVTQSCPAQMHSDRLKQGKAQEVQPQQLTERLSPALPCFNFVGYF